MPNRADRRKAKKNQKKAPVWAHMTKQEKQEQLFKNGITDADVKKAYLEIGAQPGDTIIMHGSLSSMGTVDGGPKTVFNGMLEACSPCGTVGMATLWYEKQGMLEKDAYCTDILMQVSAITSALQSFNEQLLANHINTCVADGIRCGNDEVVEELIGVLRKLMR